MSFISDLHGKPAAYRRLNHRILAGIQKKVVKQGKRHAVVRFVLAKSNKEKIAGWKQDLVRVLHVFNVRSIGLVGYP